MRLVGLIKMLNEDQGKREKGGWSFILFKGIFGFKLWKQIRLLLPGYVWMQYEHKGMLA